MSTVGICFCRKTTIKWQTLTAIFTITITLFAQISSLSGYNPISNTTKYDNIISMGEHTHRVGIFRYLYDFHSSPPFLLASVKADSTAFLISLTNVAIGYFIFAPKWNVSV